ncbi:MAG: hypothetical protein WA975_21705 [Mesorhizobium sp.]
MARVFSSEVHQRRHRVVIDRHELKRIVADAVARELGIDLDAGAEMIFEFRDETEGSPGYKVGVGVTVDVVEDLTGGP